MIKDVLEKYKERIPVRVLAELLADIDEAEAKWASEGIPIIHGKAELELHDKVVRATAIDEFAEKLCDAFSENYGEVTVDGIKFDVLTLDGATEITWDIAEQLKEE